MGNVGFNVLSSLSRSKASSGIAQEASNLVRDLQTVKSRLGSATLGGKSAQRLVKPGAELLVASFQRRALEKELRANAAMIERQLELQKAVLEALTEGLMADLEVILQDRSYGQVAQPFVSGGSNLPARWKKVRQEVLSSYLVMASAENAARAAAELKEAFIALVENRITADDFGDLFADIERIVELVEFVKESGSQ